MSENTEDEAETLQDEEDIPSISDQELVLESTAELSEKSTIDTNIATLSYSFGYNCKKLYNLVLIDEDVLVFASGNLIHFFQISTREITTRRSSDAGIGSITKNPSSKYPGHLTVAENGKKANIYIYKFPEMNLISLLKKGATCQYTLVDYSADGELLGSQGGFPDYTITIWDWKRQEIKLRAKSFGNDVLNIFFSPWVPEQLTTCGIGHVKFWRMSDTFTGLKLQGVPGRFGKTEICNILGVYSMPDEKVLSGCEWGNILVWDEGLIKFEVCRKNRKPCHVGQITQISMHGEEVTTVGTDGFIRVWFWETVELADPPEDDLFVEIEPVLEYKIGNAELLKITSNDAGDKWFGQDGNGGIWKFTMSQENPSIPEQVFRCHSGEIVGLGVSPQSHHIATLAETGHLHVYDYQKRSMIFHHQFVAPGRDVIWVPTTVDSSGHILILGFGDGITRVVALNLLANGSGEYVQLIQAIKCHRLGITKLSLNPTGNLLVSGAEDATIFIYRISKENPPYIRLVPIGFVKVPDIVTCITWNPKFSSSLIVGCQHGQVSEISILNTEEFQQKFTYLLDNVEVKSLTFKSTKSQMKRDLKLREIEERRAVRRKEKKKEFERLQIEDPMMNMTEEEFLESANDDADFDELEPIFIPKETSPILWIQCTFDDTLWLSMGGYDAGYLYEYKFDQDGPLSSTAIPDADNLEINVFVVLDHHQIFGMGDGSIRIIKRKKNWHELNDYWKLNMHDIFYGKIADIKFSFDGKFFFTVGADGNIFSYNWNGPVKEIKGTSVKPMEKLKQAVQDITDPDFLSLEQQKERENVDLKKKIASDNKNHVLMIIAEYKKEFEAIMMRNQTLPESQRLKSAELILDPRITDDLQAKLNAEMEKVREKQAFEFEKAQIAGRKLLEYFIEPLESYPIEVLGIRNKKSVYSFRIKKLDDEYFFLKEDLEERIRLDAEKRRAFDDFEETSSERFQDVTDVSLRSCESDSSIQAVESFLTGLTPSTIENKLESKMRRLLNKYRERKAKEASRKKEWEKVNSEKPNPDVDHPDDVKGIEEAQETIGDYKLKSDPQFDPPEELRDSTLKKYLELFGIREEIYKIRHDYNKKVFTLRDKKCQLIKYIAKKMKKLESIHSEIPKESKKFTQISVEFLPEKEFPEKNFQLETYYDGPGQTKEFDCNGKEIVGLKNENEHVLLDLQKRVLGTSKKDSSEKTEDLSDWETELKNLRLKRALFEQDQILEKVNSRIEEYDEELGKVAEERYQVEVQAKFKELYLLTLNQELWTLKDFEFLEDQMIEDVDEKVQEKRQLTMKLNQAKTDLDMYRRNIDELESSVKAIEFSFLTQITDAGKFAGFLRKIFKKKLPKQSGPRRSSRRLSRVQSEATTNDPDADQESSESSDSESSDEETDVTIKYLDESVCPKGCDPGLYQMAFGLRNSRHQVEREIREKQASVQRCYRDVDFAGEDLKSAERELEERKIKLANFRHDKQKALNNVDTLVMLKMDQMQYFKNQEEFEEIDLTLLFNSSNLSKLYARVGQLALETIEVKRKHRINVIHLAKMKTDIKHMEKQISDLKDETNQAILKKFGRMINLDDLEETILRRFTYDMRANIMDIKKEYMLKINEIKKSIAKKQEEYNRVIQEGTEKLNILTVLEEEKNYLRQVLMYQQKTKEKGDFKRDIGRDLDKLKEISKHQVDQIEMLQREIRSLSLKSKQFISAAQEFQCHVTQLGSDKFINESIDSPPRDSLISSHRTSPDHEKDQEVHGEISNLISKFLNENLRQEIPDSELLAIGGKLTKYLTEVALNFDPKSMDEILPKVVQEFQRFFPPGFEFFAQPAKIAKLFEKIVGNFKTVEVDVNPRVFLKEVLNQILESKVFFDDAMFSQELLVELLKQMLVTMRIDDILSDQFASEAAEILSQIPKFDLQKINFDELAKSCGEIISMENLDDEIDGEVIVEILEKILSKFK